MSIAVTRVGVAVGVRTVMYMCFGAASFICEEPGVSATTYTLPLSDSQMFRLLNFLSFSEKLILSFRRAICAPYVLFLSVYEAT